MIGLGFSVSNERIWKKTAEIYADSNFDETGSKIVQNCQKFALFPLFFAFNFFPKQILRQNQFFYLIMELIFLGSY
jgi:hypothetical protein